MSGRILPHILKELKTNYLANLTAEQQSDFNHVCSQIVSAFSYYNRITRIKEGKRFVSCHIDNIARQLIQYIPELHEHLPDIETKIKDFQIRTSPLLRSGAILISEDKKQVLLVRTGQKKWSFPKGHIEDGENPAECAIREVLEETNFDITNLIVTTDYMDGVQNSQCTRLYIIYNVSMDTKFAPSSTETEVKCCQWFPVEFLPIGIEDEISKEKFNLKATSFYVTWPFIKDLKELLNKDTQD